ncbi:MAG: hypothetical protein FWD03_05690, partial [Defluviitaleaceae bacterium]|nr:hypothetical protein [Defluviitaleaceae bacterium]
MKQKTLHMIGNAHIDPVWLWPWQEGYGEIKATFRSALDRMKEYDDFYFTASSSCFYEWVEENEPAMFEEIKQRIAEGRWATVGGWWVEPDCTVPSGESFVRHGLYGQLYYLNKFGKLATTGFNVDSFGHSGSLPQILKKSGIENYAFLRPGRHEKGIETDTFLWRSKDGSEVCAFRIPFQYNSWHDEISGHVLRCAGEIKEDSGSIMCFYGVGNHGGGPTIKNIESILEMNRQADMPNLMMSTPDKYFDEVKKSGRSLPIIYGDLFHHASGCYSANSEVKRLNRRAENRLMMAEKVSVAAKTWSHGKYPLEKYTNSWKNVLFNQFHDIMTGTSIQSAYEDAKEAYGEALHTAAHGLNAAMQAISWHIDIPYEEGAKPIVVFNPNAFPGKFEVEMEASRLSENTVLVDDKGEQVPLQLVQAEGTTNGRVRICFVADLPSMGYRTYRLVVLNKEVAKTFPDVEATHTMAQNRWLKVMFDEETGYITSLRKKNDNTEYFRGPAAVPVVMEDKSDTWSHGVTKFDKKVDQFYATTVRKVESGPVKAVIRVVSHYEKSRIIQDFSIYNELDFVHVKTTVDWREQHAMLKLAFPMNLSAMRATWETAYGTSLREPNGEEFPMQKFVDVEGVSPDFYTSSTPITGMSFINDGKTSGAIDGQDVYLTVLRSPIFAHHDPTVPDENLEYTYQDQGIQTFNYAMYPHDGSWESAHTVRRSRELNEKAVAVYETFHEGHLPQHNCFVDVDAENVLLASIKEAEDASGDVILRFVEMVGRPCVTKVELYGLKRSFDLEMAAFEIKTLRVPRQAHMDIVETDLLERV